MCVINKQTALGIQSGIVLVEMREITHTPQKDVSALPNNAPPASLRWCVFYHPLEYMKERCFSTNSASSKIKILQVTIGMQLI